MFIDPGSMTYTGKTFSDDKSEVWTATSKFHNTPILNGFEQEFGFQGDFNGKYRTTDVECDLKKGEMSIELKNVYPDNNGIVSCVRTTGMKDDVVTVTDDFEFESTGEYTFNLISLTAPKIEKGKLIFADGEDKIICLFNQDYSASVEERPLEDTSTRSIWRQECIYRVKITKFTNKGRFTLTIKELN